MNHDFRFNTLTMTVRVLPACTTVVNNTDLFPNKCFRKITIINRDFCVPSFCAEPPTLNIHFHVRGRGRKCFKTFVCAARSLGARRAAKKYL